MQSPETPRHPIDRAFVVQLEDGAEPTVAGLRGRVEHVVSGRSSHFLSVEQLVAFMGTGSPPQANAPDPINPGRGHPGSGRSAPDVSGRERPSP